MQVLQGRGALPETYTTDAERELWGAEYMICNDLSDMVKATQLRESFIGAVCAYVEKWDPYFHHEVIDLYLEQQKTIIKVTIVLFQPSKKDKCRFFLKKTLHSIARLCGFLYFCPHQTTRN